MIGKRLGVTELRLWHFVLKVVDVVAAVISINCLPLTIADNHNNHNLFSRPTRRLLLAYAACCCLELEARVRVACATRSEYFVDLLSVRSMLCSLTKKLATRLRALPSCLPAC